MDRHFAEAKSRLMQPVDRFHEERIAGVVHLDEIHIGQPRHAKSAKRCGEFVQRQSQQQARGGVRDLTDENAIAGVVTRPAGHVARAGDEVRIGEPCDQFWNVARIMRQVRVHRHQRVVSPAHREHHRKVMGGAEPELAGPMDDDQPLILRCDRIQEIAGAVRRIVVDDQDVRLRHRAPDVGDEALHIVPLVVSRREDQKVAGLSVSLHAFHLSPGGRAASQ